MKRGERSPRECAHESAKRRASHKVTLPLPPTHVPYFRLHWRVPTAGIPPRPQTYLDRRDLLISAFPDMWWTLLEQSVSTVDTEDETGEAERVVTSWRWKGTHLGPYHTQIDGLFRDIPPSSNVVSMHGIAVDTCRNGKIIDHASYYDEASLIRQLRTNGELHANGKMVAGGSEDRLLAAAEAGMSELHSSAQVQMEAFYSHKYLSQLARVCTDTGFAICLGGAVLGRRSAAAIEPAPEGTLPLCMCSGGLPFVLGLPDGEAALGIDLVELLVGMVEGGAEAPEVRMLRDAVANGHSMQEVFSCGGVDSPKVLLVSLTPFMFDGCNFFTAVVLDWLVDPGLHSELP